jgi:hypothetical protein
MNSKLGSNMRIAFVYILLLYITICCYGAYAGPLSIDQRTKGDYSPAISHANNVNIYNDKQPSASHIAIIKFSLKQDGAPGPYDTNFNVDIDVYNDGKTAAEECNIYIEAIIEPFSKKACVDFMTSFAKLLSGVSAPYNPPLPVNDLPFGLEPNRHYTKNEIISCPNELLFKPGHTLQVRCNDNVNSNIINR